MRAGVVQLNLKAAADLSKTKVWKFALWRHGDEEDVTREHAVDALADMLKGMIAAAKKKRVKLAPFIGIGCPGVIEHDGSIDRGAQNLPATRPAASSICRSSCARPFPGSVRTRPQSSCTMTPSCRA